MVGRLVVAPPCFPLLKSIYYHKIVQLMETAKIIRLKNLSSTSKKRIYDGQKESAKLWNFCIITHKESRDSKEKWPTQNL